jgi:hypothetical protein
LLTPLVALLLAAAGPRYTESGDLVVPADYRTWVFMSSGIDMSYTDRPAMQGQSMFDNVFVDPESWQSFAASGHWPDKSMFALESRGAATKGSINKHGQYQTQDLMGVEFHVRDESRFKGGWAFFAVDEHGAGKFIPYTAACYACHLAHGAVDTTFTQFYPTARPVAVAHGTYHAP